MKHSAVTIGTFDGIHLGHQYLIKKLLKVSVKNGIRSVVVSITQPVRKVDGVLSTPHEKTDILREFPIDEIYVLKHGRSLTRQKPQEFFKNFLIDKLKMSHMVLGADFAFGYKRKGTISWLKKHSKKFNIKLDVINPLKDSFGIISSSKIRAFAQKGELSKVNRFLGRYYSYFGHKIHGRGLGAKMGFPTINLSSRHCKILPEGVFISYAQVRNKMYPSLINIGRRPTVSRNLNRIVEVHLLDFNKKINPKTLKVYFVKKLRSEKKFKSIEALKHQIARDVISAKKFFEKRKK